MQAPTPLREDQFLTFEMAMEQFNLASQVIHKAIADGSIRTAHVGDTLILSRKDVADLAGDLLVNRSQFRHLENKSISPVEATRKYGLPLSTLDRWIRQGRIKVVDSDPPGRSRKLLRESDVAYVSRLAKIKGTRGGRSLFVE